MTDIKLTNEQARLFRKSIKHLFSAIAARENVYAERNFKCCSTCATSALMDRWNMDGKQKGGMVYYHKQDSPSIKYGEVDVRYSSFAETEEATARIAKAVCETASEFGLTAEWNGSINRVVTLRYSAE